MYLKMYFIGVLEVFYRCFRDVLEMFYRCFRDVLGCILDIFWGFLRHFYQVALRLPTRKRHLCYNVFFIHI